MTRVTKAYLTHRVPSWPQGRAEPEEVNGVHLLRDSFELVHHRAHGVGELPAGIVEVVLHVLAVKRPNGLCI